MRIVLVNYRYFVSGGPERYLFNVKELLENNGHTVIPYSISNTRNQYSEYSNYFLSPGVDENEIYFDSNKKKSLKDYYKGFTRMVYSLEAKHSFAKLLNDVKPDLVYILYFQNKISCSIVDAAVELNIPIVQRISDFSLIAPCNHLHRTDVNEICEKCVSGSKFNAIKYKCIFNSHIYSAVKSLALNVQDLVNIKKKISGFVFPSTFTLGKFLDAGFPEKKLHHLPTLFNTNIIKENSSIEYRNFALYIGRIDPDKGIKTMLEAFINTDYNLKIIGFSSSGYLDQMKSFLEGKKHNIEFLGKMDFDGIQDYLSKCLFTIIPSEWYENLPNTLLESFAFKKAAIVSNVGSLTENVTHNSNGLLFKIRDSQDLFEQVDFLFKNKSKAISMGDKAYEGILSKFSEQVHYNSLINVFNNVLENEKEI